MENIKSLQRIQKLFINDLKQIIKTKLILLQQTVENVSEYFAQCVLFSFLYAEYRFSGFYQFSTNQFQLHN